MVYSTAAPNLNSVISDSKFLAIESPADNTVVAPNQPIHKTWRVKNTGNRIWGADYKLVFIGGDQMSAPNEVNIPLTEPGGVADLSIDITAPATSGTHRGEWRLRNPQGTFFGDKLWVQIVVPETNNPQPPDTSTMRLNCINDCPTTVAPGQSFRPTVRVSGSVPLLQSRGDMLRNTDGNLYGAHELVAVAGTVNQGQDYDFTFYEQNPITAPNNESVYESKWRIWQNGGWVGPELTIRFEVKVGSGANHPPNAPTLTSPGDWAVYTGNSGITLQAQQNGDPDGDAITHYYFEIFESAQTPNSGWITSSSWSPSGLGNYGFQWHAKVRDARGAESGWSEVRHFNINDPNPQIQSFTWTWCHEPWGAPDKICFCAKTTGGGLELKLNSANDGSDRGAWKVIGHGDTNLNCDNDNDRPPNWGQLEVEAGSYRVRLFAQPKGAGGWPAAATADVVVSLPSNQKPGSPFGIAPAYDEYVNTKTVTLDWQHSYRTTDYQLQVSLDPNFGTLLVDTHLPPNVSEYTHTFADEHATVYWQVLATGPYGTNDSGRKPFHIDLTPPSSAISALPMVTTDTKFNVNWSGADARAGLRWYHIQVRDGKRADSQWSDWLVNTTKTAELFVGQPGHTYYFRVRAMDNLGTWEEWPAGDGDTYTLVDPSALPPTTWWNNSYSTKRNLIILNNDSDSIPAQQPLRLHFDNTTSPTAAEIYNASLSATKGDDLRIVYNNQTEVARYIVRFTASAIDLWFPYQIGLGGGQTDNGSHQLYYGNAQANNPPADVNTVFLPKADGNTMGLWHFQEGSGSTVYDASGRAHHGNFINSGWADGYWGRAGSFNGSNAYVEIGHSDDFKPGAITLEAWIYLTGSTGEYPMIFNKDRYWFRLTGGGEPQFLIKADGGDRTITGQSKLTQNKWYHLAATYDGGQVMRLFVNGKLDREQTDGAPPVLWNTQPLRIGRSDYNAASYFPGYIQHARVSNVARTDFAYGAIDVAPAVEVGSMIAPPVPGTPDLTVLGLNTYLNPAGGVIVEALVQNQGNRETQNGFYTDLYVDHVPTGAGDYTGSVQFWVNSPIAAGATITLTTVLTDFNSNAIVAAQSQALGAEITHMLYMQTDSAGVVPDADKANNILASGVEVCLANPDAFEEDNEVTQAHTLSINQMQSHNLSSAGDQDWVKFNAEAGKEYIFSTRNLGSAADTYLYLYNTDGTTLLIANDDSNDTLASEIHWTAPKSATYYLLVRHWNPNVAGCGANYELLAEVAAAAAPTPTVTPTATATPMPIITPTPTATPTPTSIKPQTGATYAIYLPSIQRNSNGSAPIDAVTVTPIPSAALLSNTLVATCQWAIQMGLTGFTPNSQVTVSSTYSEVTCPNGEQITSSWSQIYHTLTDANGALVVAYLHQGTGSYTYTFTDQMGKSATLSFNTLTGKVTATQSPTITPVNTSTPTPTSTSTPTQPATVTATASATSTPVPTTTPTGTATATLTPVTAVINWRRLNSATKPSPRGGAAFAYDATHHKLLLFGGTCAGYACSDTWEYSNADWQSNNVIGPSAREEAVMVYDSVRQRSVLFGGHIWADGYLADTWEYDGSNWLLVQTTNAPIDRATQGMAYDEVRGKVVLYGGWRGDHLGVNILGDTWEYDGNNWTQMTPPTTPGQRTGVKLVYNPELGKVILFGGLFRSGDQSSYPNDTWMYDGQTWSEIVTNSAPPGRYDHQMTYDPVRKVIVLFGGYRADTGSLSDTWEFDGANWRTVTPLTTPPPTWVASMFYYPPLSGIVMFGGHSPNQGNLQNTMWFYGPEN
ncbi:MAG: NBR1-Ig-like domain-containing protein [Caldilineaceae bacterium]